MVLSTLQLRQRACDKLAARALSFHARQTIRGLIPDVL